MSTLRVVYDRVQHCTAYQDVVGKNVSSDACPATGGKGEELSPGELVSAGLAGCMLFSMGLVAGRDELDLSGTRVDVNVTMGADHIEAIDLAFVVPHEFTAHDRAKLERAAAACPIKSSFRKDVSIDVRYKYEAPARV